MTVAIWAELFEKLVPVLSGISIALVAWMNGKRTAKLEVQAETLQVEAELKEAADEAETRIAADISTRGLSNVAASDPDNLGPVQRPRRDQVPRP